MHRNSLILFREHKVEFFQFLYYLFDGIVHIYTFVYHLNIFVYNLFKSLFVTITNCMQVCVLFQLLPQYPCLDASPQNHLVVPSPPAPKLKPLCMTLQRMRISIEKKYPRTRKSPSYILERV